MQRPSESKHVCRIVFLAVVPFALACAPASELDEYESSSAESADAPHYAAVIVDVSDMAEGSVSLGTGTFLTPNAVVTAAHVLPCDLSKLWIRRRVAGRWFNYTASHVSFAQPVGAYRIGHCAAGASYDLERAFESDVLSPQNDVAVLRLVRTEEQAPQEGIFPVVDATLKNDYSQVNRQAMYTYGPAKGVGKTRYTTPPRRIDGIGVGTFFAPLVNVTGDFVHGDSGSGFLQDRSIDGKPRVLVRGIGSILEVKPSGTILRYAPFSSNQDMLLAALRAATEDENLSIVDGRITPRQ